MMVVSEVVDPHRGRPDGRAAAGSAPGRPRDEALIPLGGGDTASLPALRAICRRVLAGWNCPARTAGDIELVVSELATNALIHTLGPVRIRLVRRDRALQLEVADTSAVAPAIATDNATDSADDESLGGRGLFIAAALADRLHVERAEDCAAGKTMIAEFQVADR